MDTLNILLKYRYFFIFRRNIHDFPDFFINRLLIRNIESVLTGIWTIYQPIYGRIFSKKPIDNGINGGTVKRVNWYFLEEKRAVWQYLHHIVLKAQLLSCIFLVFACWGRSFFVAPTSSLQPSFSLLFSLAQASSH